MHASKIFPSPDVKMTLSPYLLHVNSRPTAVDENTWTKWYTTEHLPDLVGHGASTRASFYREEASPSELVAKDATNPRKFLALYQSDHEEPLKSDGYVQKVRHTSELFRDASGKEENRENGEFDARNYKLIQDYDPNGLGNGKSSCFLLRSTGLPPHK